MERIPERSTEHRGLVTASIMLATIMQTLDTTIANVALPHMQGSLSAAQDQITWVLTSYIVAAAIMTPMTGWLTGRLGRKRVFLASVAGFTFASLLCGIAGSLAQMVVFRLLQGIFGAALVPLSQAVLLDINPRERHGQAMAIWGAGIMVGPILGPTLGGWLTDNYDWRWVFYINLPLGILAFLGILSFVRETERNRTGPFDFAGFAMLSVAVGALQMMLDRGEQQDWFGSTEIIVECALAVAAFWMFIVHVATAARPFVDPRQFKDRNFLTGTVFIFIVSTIFYGILALLPPLLQDLMDYPVVLTGELMMPRGIGTMVAMLFVGRLLSRIDIRLILLIGFALLALSLWEMTAYSLDMDSWPVIWTGVVQGFGMGFLFVPLSVVTFATLAPTYRTEATALFSLIRNLGGSIGISVATTLLAENTQVIHASMVTRVTPYNAALHLPVVQHFWNIHTINGLAALNAEVTRQAAMIAYIDDFKLLMIMTLVTAPFLALLRTGKPAPSGQPAAVMD